MLSIKNLSVKVGEKKILSDFSFEFEKGKIYAVMGPNGSGKSTLAYSIMGHPGFEVSADTMDFEGTSILEEEAHERADRGIFLSFQSPLSLSGVRLFQLIQLAMKGKKSPLEIRQNVQKIAKELHVNEELLSRSLNEGASGGEKKKLEVLQASALDTKLVIFDEVDTGVDVDALKTISQYLEKHKGDKTYIIITHYNRILHYLKPDHVLVIANGSLKKVGGPELAEEIEKNGYENTINS